MNDVANFIVSLLFTGTFILMCLFLCFLNVYKRDLWVALLNTLWNKKETKNEGKS